MRGLDVLSGIFKSRKYIGGDRDSKASGDS